MTTTARRIDWPLLAGLAAVATVWAGGVVWSFEEQTSYAASRGFELPWLLPIVIDGLALSLALVATVAALDARPAVLARLGTALAVAASSGSNAAWAWARSGGDVDTVLLAAGVPIAANLAFEVLLAEVRRQVHRRRGVPAPVAVPCPRPIRIVLAPLSTFTEWRALVLEVTALPAPAAAAADLTPIVQAVEPVPARTVLAAASPAPPPAERPARPKASAAARKSRPIEDLRTEVAAAIRSGALAARPSADAIRQHLRIAPATARALRDDVTAGRIHTDPIPAAT